MSESNFQELKELILDLNKRMELGFSEFRAEFNQVRAEMKLVEERLTDKINQVQETLTGRINQVEEKLTGKINQVEEKLTGQINQVEEKLTGKINQVEERLTGRINQVEEKLTGMDKRIANEELVSRGVFIALVGGVVTGLTKFFFFP